VRPVYGDPPDSTVVEKSTVVGDSTVVEYSTVVENPRADTDDAPNEAAIPLRITS